MTIDHIQKPIPKIRIVPPIRIRTSFSYWDFARILLTTTSFVANNRTRPIMRRQTGQFPASTVAVNVPCAKTTSRSSSRFYCVSLSNNDINERFPIRTVVNSRRERAKETGTREKRLQTVVFTQRRPICSQSITSNGDQGPG